MSWAEFVTWVTGQGMNLMMVILKTLIIGAAGYLLISLTV